MSQTKKSVVVVCDGLKLKLTCTAPLLERPFTDCILKPFLGAFSKKRGGVEWAPAQLTKVEVDGNEVKDLMASGATVLAETGESPTVILHLPQKSASAQVAAVPAAVDAILALDSSSNGGEKAVSADTWRDAFQALRLATRDSITSAPPYISVRLVTLLARHTCLLVPPSDDAPNVEWTSAAPEAIAALNNLLVADRSKAASHLCAEQLGVLSHIEGLLQRVSEFASRVPAERVAQMMPRLQLLGPIIFQLSLCPEVLPKHVKGLKAAALAALGGIAGLLSVAGESPHKPSAGSDAEKESEPVAGFCAHLVRATFNLLRMGNLDDATSAKVVTVVAGLLGGGDSEPVHTGADAPRRPTPSAAIREMRHAALQMLFLLPEGATTFSPALCRGWRTVCDDLLEPQVRLKEALSQPTAAGVAARDGGSAEDAAKECVLPLIILQRMADANIEMRQALKERIFTKAVLEADYGSADRDPYNPAGQEGRWDPNAPIDADTPLSLVLIKQLTCMNDMLNMMTRNMLFSACGEDPQDFTLLVGLGSAAGLLQEKGLFAQFQQQVQELNVSD